METPIISSLRKVCSLLATYMKAESPKKALTIIEQISISKYSSCLPDKFDEVWAFQSLSTQPLIQLASIDIFGANPLRALSIRIHAFKFESYK